MLQKNMKRAKGDRYYKDIARKYEEVRSKQPWWNVEQNEMKILLDKLPENLSVVDIPFGTGRFVPYYLERGYSVFGLDASDDMLSTAREILKDQFEYCTVTRGYSNDLPYNDGQFDLVVSTRFLRDIILYGNVKKTMKEFSRVTKRYAIIQLGVKNVSPYEIPPENEKMGSRMSDKQTERFLRNYDFEVITSKFVKGTSDGSSEIRHFLCEKML